MTSAFSEQRFRPTSFWSAAFFAVSAARLFLSFMTPYALAASMLIQLSVLAASPGPAPFPSRSVRLELCNPLDAGTRCILGRRSNLRAQGLHLAAANIRLSHLLSGCVSSLWRVPPGNQKLGYKSRPDEEFRFISAARH
jgi:hypothetical protein